MRTTTAEPADAAIESSQRIAPVVTNDTIKEVETRPDDSGAHSLKVKQEFVLTERASCLAPLPELAPDTRDEDNKKSGRCQNKKRPRDLRPINKFCQAVLQGKECPYENCKFSHDLKEAAATRPPDIVEVEGGCPNYNLKGFCEYGVRCRLGCKSYQSCHGSILCQGQCDATSTRYECSFS